MISIYLAEREPTSIKMKAVLVEQIQDIANRVCGQLVVEIANLYEKEIAKLRHDLRMANEVIARLQGYDMQDDVQDDMPYGTVDEEAIEYDGNSDEIEPIPISLVNIQGEIEEYAFDDIDIKVEPPMSNTDHYDDEIHTQNAEEPVKLTFDADKPFQCTEPNCYRRYITRGALNVHFRAFHLRQKPYKCDEPTCEKAFRSPSELKRHSKIHGRNKDKVIYARMRNK